MLYSRDELDARVMRYAAATGARIEAFLGLGAQGVVYSTDRETAIKAHGLVAAYLRERDTYLRLMSHGIRDLRGLKIPTLHDFDDELCIIEMARVSPPYLLDFGGAFLDVAPDFGYDEQTQADEIAERREMFGTDWPEVQAVLRAFESFGIYLIDVNPGNIRFRRED